MIIILNFVSNSTNNLYKHIKSQLRTKQDDDLLCNQKQINNFT